MLEGTALAAVAATALGVTAMVIAMALMSGYTQAVERRLIGLQGEVIATPLAGSDVEAAQDALAEAAQLEGVQRVGRVIYGEGSISGPAAPEGVSIVIRAVDEDDPVVHQHGGTLNADGKTRDDLPGIVLGGELANRLGTAPGEVLRLVVLDMRDARPKFRYRSVRVTGTFTVGFAEFDSRWVLVHRDVLQQKETSSAQRLYEMIELKLNEGADGDRIAAELTGLLGDGWVVDRWERLNRDLFSALGLQKTLLFFVLGLIVLVSTFNISSTLVILVRERMRDIGVLSSLGLRPRRLWWLFTIYGLLLGSVGTLLGILVGTGVSVVITEFELIRFPPEVAEIYFIDSVPFLIQGADLAAIAAFSLVTTLAACSLPARRAARVLPSNALRDE